jgi:hypothetical protein
MADVLIHRCTLRVVRRGGWSWGPDPKRFLEDVIRAFPALLARKLTELLPADADREVAAPVRIRVPIRMSDLVPEGFAESRLEPSGSMRRSVNLEERLESALRAAFDLGSDAPAQEPRTDRFGRVGSKFREEPSQRRPHPGGALQRLLFEWHEAGRLESRLALISPEEIELWHHALRGHLAHSSSSTTPADSSLVEQIETRVRAQALAAAGRDRAGRLRLRVALATEIARQLRVPLDALAVWDTLDRLLPVEEPAPTDPTPANASDGRSLASHREARAPLATIPRPPMAIVAEPGRAVETAHQQSAEWDVQIACALPFLLLSPLVRLGYFATVAAVLEAAGLSDDAPLFAAALAYKVLDPPERGWRRAPAARLSAAAFAGLRALVAEDALVDFSRRIAPHIGLLDVLLADALLQGHTPGAPALLCRRDPGGSNGLMLIDVQGCFPIAWTDDLDALLPILRKLDDPILLLSGGTALPQLLRDLDAAGVPFVSPVPPTRDEPWRRVQQGPRVLGWTNHPAPASEPLLRAARDLTTAADEADALCAALAARPSVVRAQSAALDRSLTLAAALAMGMIAWTLWRARSRTTPQLVLERFCDLDARVRFDSASILVRLPLGRRHRELSESGLLASLDDIPWLDRRRVEFGGG